MISHNIISLWIQIRFPGVIDSIGRINSKVIQVLLGCSPNHQLNHMDPIIQSQKDQMKNTRKVWNQVSIASTLLKYNQISICNHNTISNTMVRTQDKVIQCTQIKETCLDTRVIQHQEARSCQVQTEETSSQSSLINQMIIIGRSWKRSHQL